MAKDTLRNIKRQVRKGLNGHGSDLKLTTCRIRRGIKLHVPAQTVKGVSFPQLEVVSRNPVHVVRQALDSLQAQVDAYRQASA